MPGGAPSSTTPTGKARSTSWSRTPTTPTSSSRTATSSSGRGGSARPRSGSLPPCEGPPVNSLRDSPFRRTVPSMHRALLLVVCLALCAACQGSGHATVTPVSSPPADFSGTWDVQLVILQDECGFCPSGTAVVEALKIDQIQDTVTASLSGHSLRADGSGSVTGTTMNLTFSGSIFLNTWFFIDSPASASCSLSNGAIHGALFVQLGNLG